MNRTFPCAVESRSISSRWLNIVTRAATFVWLASCAIGCGGDDEMVDAAGACRATVETFASKHAACAIETGEIPASDRDQYIKDFTARADGPVVCWNVTKILGNPDQCATNLNAIPCVSYSPRQGLPLPQSCVRLYGTN
jgi:hypothetical protein